MPHPNDQDEPTIYDWLTFVPPAWASAPVVPAALVPECACPADCLRDHENE
jgi:hypothetical protein